MSSSKKTKRTTKTPSLSSAEKGLTKTEQASVNNLFTQALSRYKDELLSDKKDKHKELRHLALIAEEYLSCFVLMGYSLQNEEVVIFNTPTSKDEAAIIDLLRATFIDVANNRL